MGLLLGGSVLTVFELVDFIFFHYLNKFFGKPDNEAPKEDETKDVTTENLASKTKVKDLVPKANDVAPKGKDSTTRVVDLSKRPSHHKVSFSSNCVEPKI